jgi:hypothetical protein
MARIAYCDFTLAEYTSFSIDEYEAYLVCHETADLQVTLQATALYIPGMISAQAHSCTRTHGIYSPGAQAAQVQQN